MLVGDSPVEGIGNDHHHHALGGQTARAFAKLVCRDGGYDRVRYWSYGKSGLTARGIQEDMVPFVHRVVDDLQRRDEDDPDGTNGGGGASSSEPAIHAVVLLCGVNNVLDPRSTAASFHSEVRSLLGSIRGRPGLEHTPVVVLGLPDFAKLPFLPWPLCFALGLRGRRMQRVLELAVNEFQPNNANNGKTDKHRRQRGTRTVMVQIPDVQDVIGTIGYHRHDSNAECKMDNDPTSNAPLKMKLCHPLLRYLGNSLDQSKLGSLGMEDFLCGDGFHPGGYGTTYIGNLIAETYGQVTR